MRKIILGSTFYKRDGLYPQFWESLSHSTIKDMTQLLKDAYEKVAPDFNDLSKMYEKDKKRMIEFKDWKAEDIHSINAPALIIISDEDVVRPEHAVECIDCYRMHDFRYFLEYTGHISAKSPKEWNTAKSLT